MYDYQKTSALTLLDEILSLIKQNHYNLDSATSSNHINIDMTVIDHKVQHFCTIVNNLPKAEALKYRQNMHNIITDLNNLVIKLEQKKSTLGDKIDSLNKQNIAFNAYGNAMILALSEE